MSEESRVQTPTKNRMRLRRTNILQEKKKAMTAMSIALSCLLKSIKEHGKLSRDEHASLIGYIKLINEMEETEKDELNEHTLEELEEMRKSNYLRKGTKSE